MSRVSQADLEALQYRVKILEEWKNHIYPIISKLQGNPVASPYPTVSSASVGSAPMYPTTPSVSVGSAPMYPTMPSASVVTAPIYPTMPSSSVVTAPRYPKLGGIRRKTRKNRK